MKPLRVLNIEDSEDDAALLHLHLTRAGYDVLHDRVQTADAMKNALAAQEWDIIISDFQMPNFTGLEALEVLKQSSLDIPFILISGTIGEETAVQAMLAGVSDYMMKDKLARLVPAIERELKESAQRRARRQAELDLQKSEARYRDLFENANDTIFTIDLVGNITSINKMGEELTGYTLEEILGMNLAELFIKEDAHLVRERIEQKISREIEITRYEATLKSKNNNRKHIEISSRIVYNDEIPIEIQCIARDITERKKAEKELRESEADFSALVRATTQVVWSINAAGESENSPQWWLDLTGQSIEEAKGFGWLDAVHPEDREFVRTEWTKAFTDRVLFSAVYRVLMVVGEYHYYAVRGVPVFDETGAFRRWIGTFTDITERKRFEGKLRESEARLRLSQQAARVGTWEWNIETNEEVWSDGIWLLLGLKPGEITSNYENWMRFLTPESITILENALEIAIAGGDILDTEFRITTSDGRILWLASKGRVIRSETGKAERVLGVNIDITERKQAEEDLHKSEEKLRQAQKLESIGRLAGGIAHDFNNMLTAINGYSDLLLRRLPNHDPHRSYIKEIREAGERSAALTHQLLAFSRRQILQPKIVIINEIISNTTGLLQRLIGEDIQIISALSSDIGQVKADPGQMSQVIMNLVVNSRDAMPQGGTISIETENIYLDEEFVKQNIEAKVGDYVVMAISDNGTGMDEDTLLQIFEPFYTTKEVGKGTGLGLATIHGIVNQSGGFINVKSTPGTGSTFEIYLPRVEEKVEAEAKNNFSEEWSQGTETILLVEDELIVRKLTREILESCGYAIIEAKDGEEALEICESNKYKFDLLLTDVVMPKMGGYELAERLVKIFPQLRVLFTSGYTEDSQIRHDVTDANTDFIQKPFAPDDLSRKIREILNKDK